MEPTKLEQTAVNGTGTQAGSDTPLTREVHQTFQRDLLVKRNLAEQSKWINDPDPRPWVVHESQTIQWQMDWQKKCLAKGA
jgi:hypothetical protein